MTARRKARPRVTPTGDGRHPLASLALLPLDPATVAAVGLIRAASNAVRALPPVDPAELASARTAATAKGPHACAEFDAAPAMLIKRTVTAYAAQHPQPTQQEVAPQAPVYRVGDSYRLDGSAVVEDEEDGDDSIPF